jgi:GntR family transcriptional regulator/MocR family aminotransferase
MLPTLRLGFVVTPPSLRPAVHKAKYLADWHTSTLAQAALARFMEDGGFARHIRRMGGIYRARHDILTKALAHELADHLEVIPSAAGLHLAAVARTYSADQIAAVVRRASDAGVAVQELSRFAVDAPGRPGLVLGYGAIPTARIEEGLRRLRSSFGR